MINLRSFLIVVISFLGSITSFAQPNLLNAKTPSQIGLKSAAQLISDNDKPLEYGYVDDRDVLMGKTVWEIIDLSERINFPLYFPIDAANIGSDRRSLYDVLTKNIRNGKLTEVYSDSYFNTKKSYKDIESSLTKIDTTGIGIAGADTEVDIKVSTCVTVIGANGVIAIGFIFLIISCKSNILNLILVRIVLILYAKCNISIILFLHVSLSIFQIFLHIVSITPIIKYSLPFNSSILTGNQSIKLLIILNVSSILLAITFFTLIVVSSLSIL